MRSTLGGNLQFGDMSIPIRLYTATESGSVSFKQRHAEDNGEVRYQKVCAICGKTLQDSEIVKEFNGATFTKEELDGLKGERDKSFRVYGFCGRAELDDLILEKAHFVGTAKKEEGGYDKFTFLHKSMVKAKKVAVVGWVSRGKKHTAMMTAYGQGFLLKEILYAPEVRHIEEVEVAEVNVPDEVIGKGVKRIQSMTMKFDHEAYVDDYAESIRKIAESRSLGEITGEAPTPLPTKASSLQDLVASW